MPVFDSDAKIFVDICGLPTGSAHLVRLLKSNGATLVLELREANIVLVDPEDDQSGKKIIRDWAADPSKRVVRYAWARHCVDAGRMLTESENWAGCLLHSSQGLVNGTSEPEQPEDEDEDESGSILRPVSRPKPATLSKLSTIKKPTDNSVAQSPPLSPLTPVADETPVNAHAAHPTPPPMHQYDSTGPHGVVPSPSQYAYTNYGQSSSAPTMNHPHDPHVPSGTQPSFSSMHLPSMFPNSSQSHPPLPANLSPEQFTQMMQFLQGYMSMQTQQQQQHPGFSQLPPAAATQESVSASTPEPTNSQRSVSLPVDDHSSWKNVYGPQSPKRGKGKGKAVEIPQTILRPANFGASASTGSMMSQRGKRRSGHFANSLVGGNGHNESYRAGNSQAYASGSATPTSQASPIFSQPDGRSMLFFVPLAVRKRRDLVLSIGKHGGRVVTELSDADYAVFDGIPGQKKDINVFLRECIQLEKIAVNTDFIKDCVEQEEFLSVHDYLFDSSQRKNSVKEKSPARKPVQRGVKREESRSVSPLTDVEEVSSPPPPPVKTKRPNKSAGKSSSTASPLPAKIRRKSQQVHSSPAPASKRGTPARSPSPQPPPANQSAQQQCGKYIYTEAEQLYARREIIHLVERNPDITVASISRRLHEKVPHHTQPSWGMYVPKLVPDLHDRRNKAHIAKRKKDHLQEKGEGKKKKRPGTPGTALERENEDFNFICRFFANGEAGNEADEAIWQKLGQLRTCQTEKQWSYFYLHRQDAINLEIQRLLAERGVHMDIKSEGEER